MIKKIIFSLLISLQLILIEPITASCSDNNCIDKITFNKNIRNIKTDYEWTIVGAGPAGIIAVAILLELGIPYSKILWIDQTFQVGRMGQYYGNLDGNTKNKDWIKFLETSPLIAEITQDEINLFKAENPECYLPLQKIVDAFDKVTKYLLSKINHEYGYLQSIDFWNGIWHVKVNENNFTSRSTILAIGSSPISINYEEAKFSDIIPLDYALNKEFLAATMHSNDKVAVFGSAHSAILILKYLTDLPTQVASIYNFYNRDFIYAVDTECPLLKNMTGPLHGVASWWATNVLLKNPPQNLKRIKNTQENRKEFLSECNKIIYAVGYKMNQLPDITIDDEKITNENISFNSETGVIGPRLFGFGIAFPGSGKDAYGNPQLKIGCNSFIEYALNLMPEWIIKKESYTKNDYKIKKLNGFNEYIDVLIL